MIVKRNKQTSEEKDEKKSDIKSIGIGVGLVGAGLLAKRGGGNRQVLLNDKKLAEENNNIFEKLKKIGEDQGTAVYKAAGTKKSWDGGFYYNKGRLRGPYKYLDKQGAKPGEAGDLIVTSKNADILAHELGHSKYSKKGRAGGFDGKVGRAAHKVDNISRGFIGPPGWAHSFLVGMTSGAIGESRKLRGKKENKLIRHSSWGIPTIITLPTLVAEGMASRKGLKLLKDAGASKELLSRSKKNLSKAWGTYAANTIVSAGSGEIGRVAGKKLIRRLNKADAKKTKQENL